MLSKNPVMVGDSEDSFMNALMNKDVSNSGPILGLLKPNEEIVYRSY